ncbi:MAG: stage V sporulation protein AB [Defluviitaleaceae bacterium]|nr:stage V sporulation protein AB [Defluviitaleaceae bacterium]
MTIAKQGLTVLFGFGTGLIISGAVVAFITILGIVQRLAEKTGTQRYIMLYEEAIIFGVILGATTMMIDYHLPLGWLIAIAAGFFGGVFFACLSMSLAEVLNVIPILTRRIKIEKGLSFFIFALAIGKFVGAILYFTVDGFFTPKP